MTTLPRDSCQHLVSCLQSSSSSVKYQVCSVLPCALQQVSCWQCIMVHERSLLMQVCKLLRMLVQICTTLDEVPAEVGCCSIADSGLQHVCLTSGNCSLSGCLAAALICAALVPAGSPQLQPRNHLCSCPRPHCIACLQLLALRSASALASTLLCILLHPC